MQVEESDDDTGPADEDLYASASLADAASTSHQEQQDQDTDAPVMPRAMRQGSFSGPSVFGSMTLGMNRAVVQLNRAFGQLAVRAQHRRSLTRPM